MVFRGGEATAWTKRSAYFETLKLLQLTADAPQIVGMKFSLTYSPRRARLLELWSDRGNTSPIIDLVAIERGVPVLRYAAINWEWTRVDAEDVNVAGRWLVELIDAYQMLFSDVPDDVAAFCAPEVLIDLDDHLRLAFTSVPLVGGSLPPEVRADGHWDERSLVFHVGKLFGQLVTDLRTSVFHKLHKKCVEEKPARRWESFEALLEEIKGLGIELDAVRARPDVHAWQAVERGLGLLHLGYNDRAATQFKSALSCPHYEPLARWGLATAKEAFEETVKAVARRRSWQPEPEPERTTEEALVLAQRALHAGDVGFAAVLANQVLAEIPDNAEAAAIIVQVRLSKSQYEDALAQTLVLGDTPRGNYLRGKALLGLGRLHEARDAFDRALVLDPKLLEAMLLRREADRNIKQQRVEVGEARALDLEIPASLEELREVLSSGDHAWMIATLDAHPYGEQPDAQLVLARVLSFIGAHERAIAAYDRASRSKPHRHVALVGKATVLVENSAESALAIFDALCAEQPTDADASEGRARALEKLGRLGEAAAEFRRFIALATSGSDLRVRAAADWLRDHPL